MTAFKATRGGYRIGDTTYDRCTSVLSGGIPRPALLGWGKKFTALAAIIDHHTIGALIQDCNLDGDAATIHQRIKDAKTALKESPTHPDEGLVKAYNHLFNAPDRMRDKAADRGTLIHAIAEAHIEGRSLPDFTDDELPYALAFEQFLTDWEPEFLEVETTVFSTTLKVAGTFDALARIDGENWLIDWKSAAGIYPEVALQLGFYMHAPLICRPDGQTEPFGHRRDRAGAVHLRPDGTYSLVEMGGGEEDYDGFLAALRVFRWVRSVERWTPTPAVRARKEAA